MLRLCRRRLDVRHTFFGAEVRNEVTGKLPPLTATDPVGKHGQSAIAPVMLEVDYTLHEGWGVPKLRDYGPIELQPMIGSLHYGLSCWEDFNVVKDQKGNCRLFRPDYHAARFAKSCKRMALDSSFDQAEFFKCLSQMATSNKDSIPTGEGQTLRVRAMMIGNNKSLTAGAADEFKLTLCGMAADWTPPVPFKAIVGSLNLRRTWKGSTGGDNVSSNFINQIFAESQAQKKGYHTVLFIGDGETVSSLGDSNIVIAWDLDGKRQLVTPPLDGTVLPGTTRDSMIQILRDYGKLPIVERHVTIDELQKALEKGEIEEIIAVGGNHVLSNVSEITLRGKNYQLPEKMFFHISETFNKQLFKYCSSHKDWSVLLKDE